MRTQLVGHDKVKDLLCQELASPHHAYLFMGPPGIGKASLAKDFGKALLFGEEEAPEEHPDLIHLVDEKSLKKEAIAQVVEEAQKGAYEGSRKVFLLEDAHLMTDAAQNALLKSLEEPLPGVFFLLTAPSRESLLPTIASRVKSISMRSLSREELKANLLQQDPRLSREELELYAALGKGSLSRALGWMGDGDRLQERRVFLTGVLELRKRSGAWAFSLAESIGTDRARALDYAQMIADLFEDVMRQGVGPFHHPDMTRRLSEISWPPGAAEVLYDRAMKLKKDLEQNAQVRLQFEAAFLYLQEVTHD